MSSTYTAFLNKYAPVLLAHGAVRKMVHCYGAETYDFEKNKDTSMYVTTKVAITTIAAFSNLTAWPINVFRDVYDIETYVRGDTLRYKLPTSCKSWIDYFIA